MGQPEVVRFRAGHVGVCLPPVDLWMAGEVVAGADHHPCPFFLAPEFSPFKIIETSEQGRELAQSRWLEWEGECGRAEPVFIVMISEV